MPLVLQLNLKRKAALFVAVILVAVVTGVSLTLVLTAIPVIRHSDLAGAVSVGRQIVKDVRLVMDFGMALGDTDQVPEMLEEAVRRNPGLGYLCVTDAAGKLYYRSALVPADLPAATTLLNHPAGSDDKPSPDVRIRLGGESFHDVAVPLRTADGAFKAVVHLGTRASVRENASAVAEINQHVSEIASGAENVASATTELSISGRLVADSAEANAGRAEEARGAAAQVYRGGESSGALAERSREQVAERVSAAAAAGNEAVGRTLAGSESIRDEVRATGETMRALQESAGSIGQILGVIDDIADQTDLLALNASILSAQAGEHGRGFGVVAREIRTLSTRTSESTRRIATLIESVQTGAKRTSRSLQRVAGSVETGLGLGQRAQRSLEAVAASVAEAMTALRGLAGEHAALVGELAGTARRMNELSEALRRELAVFHPASPAL